MLIDRFTLLESDGRGKGLFATTDIPVGTVVGYFCEECQLLPKTEYLNLQFDHRKSLKLHSYVDVDGHLRTDCGIARYMNHSCNSHVFGTGDFDIVVRDIQAGEEVFYDYRVFYDEEWDCFECRCGEEECCGFVRCVHPIPEALQLRWDQQLEVALVQAALVEQILPEAKRLLLASPYQFVKSTVSPNARANNRRRKSRSMQRKFGS